MQTCTLVCDGGERFRRPVRGSIKTEQLLLAQCERDILASAAAIASCFQNGGKILLCGNGGSAADVQHIAAEFVSAFKQAFQRPGLSANALTTYTPVLTASANAFGFEGVFARQVQALGRPGDVRMGISTSGNSENVLRAVNYANANAITTIAFTGAGGGKLGSAVSLCVRVPATSTQYILESHIMIGHILCDLVEQSLHFPL